MKVINRNNKQVEFNINKILNAVKKAFNSCNIQIPESINNKLKEWYKTLKGDTIGIEEIQDYIETLLMSEKYYNVAKAFIIYRSQQALKREAKMLGQIKGLLKQTDSYIMKENANKKTELNNVQFSYLGGIIGAHYCRMQVFPKNILNAHDEGAIHIHDMDMSAIEGMTNCSLENLEDCLYNGTVLNDVKIDSQTKFTTACTVATQIIQGVAGLQYGGMTVTLSHLVKALKSHYDIIKKEYPKELWEKEYKKIVESGVQTFMYQVNSMYTSQGQTPFLTVNMYLNEVSEEDRPFLADIIEEVLKQRIQGFKDRNDNWVAPAFPKLIYVLQEDNIHKKDKWYYLTELAAKCSVNRCAPDYISEKVMKKIHGYCYPSMGCRSFLSPWFDEKGNAKFYGRLNCGVVSLNLPYIAAESKNSNEDFFITLEKYAKLVHQAHQIRLKRICNTPISCAPLLWRDGVFTRCKEPNTKIGELIKSEYASISLGYAGLYEMCTILGYKNHWEDGKEFAFKVMQKLNDYCKEWTLEDKVKYGVYGTPMESGTLKFAKALNKIYPSYKRLYITNSYHIPVFEDINPFKKLEIEGEFQPLSKNGCISYIECADLKNNLEAIYDVQRCIYEHCMYAELNIKSCVCYSCGSQEAQLIDENLNWYCPKCGERNPDKLRHLYRICGYPSVNDSNEGRTSDVKDRFIHLDNHEVLFD